MVPDKGLGREHLPLRFIGEVAENGLPKSGLELDTPLEMLDGFQSV